MNIVNLLIYFEFIICPELLRGNGLKMLVISLLTGLLSAMTTIIMSKMNAIALDEPFLMYFMTKLTANNMWVPFIHLIENRTLDNCIDFSDISVKIPFFTLTCGIYLKVPFQFSNMTLMRLFSELDLWQK